MYRKNLEIVKLNNYFLDNKKSFDKGFGSALKKVRTSKKLTIDKISERAITTPQYLSNLEQGRYGISLLKFICLCNSLEVTPNEILEEFLFGCKTNDDILYNKLQEKKDISQNILEFLKDKK